MWKCNKRLFGRCNKTYKISLLQLSTLARRASLWSVPLPRPKWGPALKPYQNTPEMHLDQKRQGYGLFPPGPSKAWAITEKDPTHERSSGSELLLLITTLFFSCVIRLIIKILTIWYINIILGSAPYKVKYNRVNTVLLQYTAVHALKPKWDYFCIVKININPWLLRFQMGNAVWREHTTITGSMF